MSLPPHLAVLRDEALQTSVEAWAIRCRWPMAKGIDRAGPCPNCGGKDRFAIHTVKNTFNCRRCGIAGEGVIKLVEMTQNVNFRRACEIITGRSADEPVDPERARRLKAEAEADKRRRAEEAARWEEKRRRDAWGILTGATPCHLGHIVFDYLALRGLPKAKLAASIPLDQLKLWERSELAYFSSRDVIHQGPAMIGVLRFPDGVTRGEGHYGHFGGVHRTWIDLARHKGKPDLGSDSKGRPRATKRMKGIFTGCAIRLFTPARPRRIVMGEGIESTLSVLCHAFEPDTAYWAGGSLGNMAGRAHRDAKGRQIHDQPDADSECFVPPAWCEELVYLADGDSEESRITEKLTRGLRRAMRLRPGLRAKRVPAPAAEADMNDLAMQMGAAEGVGA